MANSALRLGFWTAAALVLLRVALGWHFYSEGLKKLEPGWTSAGFLTGAKGPLAEFYSSFVPQAHDWPRLLAVAEPPQAKAAESRLLSADSPVAAWGQRIADDWQAALAKVKETASADQTPVLDAIVTDETKRLADYLKGIEPDVVDYRHELTRLGALRAEAKPGELPYVDGRVEQKQAELRGKSLGWVAAVAKQEELLIERLGEALGGGDRLKGVADAVSPSGWMPTIDRAVAALTIGAGLCLLAGCMTRVAALAAAAFLLSIISTQPPWVPEVTEQASMYFGYQSVEFAALLLVAMVGAGRWAGIDGLFHCCWSSNPKVDSPASAGPKN